MCTRNVNTGSCYYYLLADKRAIRPTWEVKQDFNFPMLLFVSRRPFNIDLVCSIEYYKKANF